MDTPNLNRPPRTLSNTLAAIALSLSVFTACWQDSSESEMRLASKEERESTAFPIETKRLLTITAVDALRNPKPPPAPVIPSALNETSAVTDETPSVSIDGTTQKFNEQATLYEITENWDYIGNRFMLGSWTASVEMSRDGAIRAMNVGDRIGDRRSDVTIIDINKDQLVVGLGEARRSLPWNARRVAEERETVARKELIKATLTQARKKFTAFDVKVDPNLPYEQRKQAETMKQMQSVLQQLETEVDSQNPDEQALNVLIMAAEMQYNAYQKSIGNETSYGR